MFSHYIDVKSCTFTGHSRKKNRGTLSPKSLFDTFYTKTDKKVYSILKTRLAVFSMSNDPDDEFT